MTDIKVTVADADIAFDSHGTGDHRCQYSEEDHCESMVVAHVGLKKGQILGHALESIQ